MLYVGVFLFFAGLIIAASTFRTSGKPTRPPAPPWKED